MLGFHLLFATFLPGLLVRRQHISQLLLDLLQLFLQLFSAPLGLFGFLLRGRQLRLCVRQLGGESLTPRLRAQRGERLTDGGTRKVLSLSSPPPPTPLDLPFGRSPAATACCRAPGSSSSCHPCCTRGSAASEAPRRASPSLPRLPENPTGRKMGKSK